MENIKAKNIRLTYGSNILYVFKDDEEVSLRPIDEEMFENATISFNENGSITLEGDCWKFGILFDSEYPKNIDYEVHPSYIEKTRFRHKDIVRAGWHRKLKNEHRKLIFNKYMIIQK